MSKGLAKVGLEQRIPVGFGVVTTTNLEQALVRAGSKAGNKGVDAALAALEMANLLRESRKTMGLSDKSGEEGAH
ncbi:MAG: 6,7-dimethyl-8-ribityllumazine synthase, partial [Synergistaceae bacterium]|jgi:6,7-dimethyl-8-ribityllumazine synthase|nr:6,7-dimethyl-8-ribityllumazine synthase [Synergistaceae bacterium]